ncbi:MAG TPA: RNA pseudouridine synthase, partial [Patescibacteria group bacterium]|nr:RNA pseudouridine synthase [Patescibacteria group bacterium]
FGQRLVWGDRVRVGKEKVGELKEGDPNQSGILAQIKILADEPDYLVVSKPAGILVHPTAAKEKITLINWLTEKYPEIKKVGENKQRPGIVHRLDKDASGLLVVAKTQKMFISLKKQFQERKVEKEYAVLVYGRLPQEHGLIDFIIDRGHEGRMVSRPKVDLLKLKNVPKQQPGKEAKTEFWRQRSLGRFDLLRVRIYSGRTHQIRVHFFAFGYPVVGDRLYFRPRLFKKCDQKLSRLFLHAENLCFMDLGGQRRCFHCPLSKELTDFLVGLEK